MSSPFRDQRARWTKPEHVAENAVYKQLLGDVIKRDPLGGRCLRSRRRGPTALKSSGWRAMAPRTAFSDAVATCAGRRPLKGENFEQPQTIAFRSRAQRAKNGTNATFRDTVHTKCSWSFRTPIIRRTPTSASPLRHGLAPRPAPPGRAGAGSKVPAAKRMEAPR